MSGDVSIKSVFIKLSCGAFTRILDAKMIVTSTCMWVLHDQDVLPIENRLHTIVGDYAKYETLLSQSNQIINATRSTILTSFRNLFSAVPENYDGMGVQLPGLVIF